MPKPRLTQHVRDRMRQRGISEEEIWAALARRRGNPQATASGSIWVYGYVPGGRILKVLLTADETTIITAAWPGE
ncbi:DUF4258 domain-containing protein [Thermopolyspora sp. NPDC052614]|uniref:DUF4258 domain-containing protein n=1 Tax=Thermopolyspora sp. NPDC052614 TaxID=3155682 RepID=UPI003419FD21